MSKSIEFYPNVILPDDESQTWDDVEVNPVWDDGKGNVDVCDEGQESYWSVYLHKVEGGVICIADLPNKADALALRSLILNIAPHYKIN